MSIDDLPRDVTVVEVRLTDEDGAPADQLAVDDKAWAVVPSDRLRRILLVSAGDPYLESALTHLPGTELYGVTPDTFGASTHPELFDLIIFEGALPDPLPARPILAIAPTKTSPLGTVTGTLTRPGIGTLPADEPILRYVDLATVHIADAAAMTLPDWARTVIPGPSKAPLLYSGTRAGLPTAVLAFDPRHSDLPLQVAFPILLSNLAGELMGGSTGPAGAVVPGTVLQLAIPTGATGVHVVQPDGSAVDLPAGTPGATSVTYAATQQLGVYTVTGTGVAEPTPGPSGSAGASPSGAASAQPVAHGITGRVRVRRWEREPGRVGASGGRCHRPVRSGPLRRGRVDDHARLRGRPRGAGLDRRRCRQPERQPRAGRHDRPRRHAPGGP